MAGVMFFGYPERTEESEREPMSGLWASGAVTMEFRREYEVERERWLRRRFLWYTGVVGALNGIGFGIAVAIAIWLLATSSRGTNVDWGDAVADGLLAAVFLFALRYGQNRPQLSRQAVLSLAFWLIVISGGVRLSLGVIDLERALASTAVEAQVSVVVGLGGVAAIFGAHIFACLFLPWTPRESFRPLIPLLVFNAMVSLWYAPSAWQTYAMIAGSPLIGAPGALVCWWRYSRFHDKFNAHILRRRYQELKRDLVNARQIHEALFPPAITEGPVRLAYRYEPMRQIGGDYLFACRSETPEGGPVLNVVLIDVTGHGIPAALTVNRLHGELERIFAENPDSGPGEVLALLNRYVHLTLARHSVYATALCVRVDPLRDELEYASAGHPPGFVRGIDGTVERLDSTTFVLGVTTGQDFEAGPRTVHFGPGDSLIAYTDGAIESRDRAGRTFGLDGLQRLIASERPRKVADGAWVDALHRASDSHRYGGNADDTLVVEVWRPLGQRAAGALPSAAEAPASAEAAPV